MEVIVCYAVVILEFIFTFFLKKGDFHLCYSIANR